MVLDEVTNTKRISRRRRVSILTIRTKNSIYSKGTKKQKKIYT